MTPARPDANQPPWHQTILDFSADWIWEIDLQGRHLYSNPAIREILGYTPEEMSGQSAFDLVHEADRDWIQKELPRHIRKKRAGGTGSCGGNTRTVAIAIWRATPIPNTTQMGNWWDSSDWTGISRSASSSFPNCKAKPSSFNA